MAVRAGPVHETVGLESLTVPEVGVEARVGARVLIRMRASEASAARRADRRAIEILR
jgi:hypothetical protein